MKFLNDKTNEKDNNDYNKISDYWWRNFFLFWQTPYILWYNLNIKNKNKKRKGSD